MSHPIPSELVASIFLKYLTLQSASLLLGSDQEVKLWVCPEHGTPSIGSGSLDDIPLDLPVACVFLPNNSNKKAHSDITSVTASSSLDQLLTHLSQQMQAQMQSFDVSSNIKALEVLPRLLKSDNEITRIAETFFSKSIPSRNFH